MLKQSVAHLVFVERVISAFSGNAFHPVNEVTLRRAGLLLGRMTACGQVNHLGM